MSAGKSYKPYRSADYHQSPAEAAEYLNAVIEDGNPRLSSLDAILQAMGLQLNVQPRSSSNARNQDLETA